MFGAKSVRGPDSLRDLGLILAVDVEDAEGGEVGPGGEHVVHRNDTGVGR